jgi:hypothetical protein
LLEQIPIAVKVEQDLNHRPVLMASDKTRSFRRLWDPNPQLRDVDWGHVELISWKDKTGWEYHADLIRPPGFSVRKALPAADSDSWICEQLVSHIRDYHELCCSGMR